MVRDLQEIRGTAGKLIRHVIVWTLTEVANSNGVDVRARLRQ